MMNHRPSKGRTARSVATIALIAAASSCGGATATTGPPSESEVASCATKLADVATNYYWGPPPDTVNIGPWEDMVLAPVGGRVNGTMTLGSSLAWSIASDAHTAQKAGKNEYQAIMLGASKACADRANFEAVMNP